MESKSGHTWSLGGVSFLQGLRDISWTQGPDSALPLITSLAGTAWTRAPLAWCRTEYSFQAVKQLVIRWGNIQPGPPLWGRLRSLLFYRFVSRITQPIERFARAVSDAISIWAVSDVLCFCWWFRKKRSKSNFLCRKIGVSSFSTPKMNTTRLFLVPSGQSLLLVTDINQQRESCTTTRTQRH